MDFRKQTIRDIDWKGKTALVRVDYNVPMKDGKIVDDMRIRESVPTIKYILEHGAKLVVLISHLGRPNGERKPELTLRPTAAKLVDYIPNIVLSFVDLGAEDGESKLNYSLKHLPKGAMMMLENLRFWPEEEANSEEFAKMIIDKVHADVFVQDGFAVIHRAHASTDAMPRLLPAVAGLLVEKEVTNLESAISNPEHPVIAIIGGAKVADKQPMIDRFLPIADKVIVGGKIAADGYYPYDGKIYVAEDFVENAEGAKLDIGAQSVQNIVNMVNWANTIIWNGTMGMTEDAEFANGSRQVAEAIGHREGVMSIIGGGDTAGYVESLMKGDPSLKYTLVSTGGGASLELLSGKQLPGLEVLNDR